jgi:hypothetical protein
MIGRHGGADHDRAHPIEMTWIVPGDYRSTRPSYIRRAHRTTRTLSVPVASGDCHTPTPSKECQCTHPGAGNPHEVHRARVVGGEKPHQ